MSQFAATFLDREELASTSDLARDLVVRGEVLLPLVVRARKQTAGRGQGDHRWWSDDGSLMFTVAINPRVYGLRAEHEPRVALAAAVGIIDAVESCLGLAGGLEIRWPNDIEANGKKIAGILPERFETPSGPRLLIGVGLNVSTRLAEAPAEIRRMAMSLEELVGFAVAPNQADVVFSSILDRFPTILERLAADDPDLAASWANRDGLAGRAVRIVIGTTTQHGIAIRIDASGGLVVAQGDRVCVYHAGQVMRD